MITQNNDNHERNELLFWVSDLLRKLIRLTRVYNCVMNGLLNIVVAFLKKNVRDLKLAVFSVSIKNGII